MDAGTEAITSTMKAVTQSTGMGVLFQNKCPFACLGQGQGRCQAPGSRSDYDCISVKHAVSSFVFSF
jgi:hypothetical protein